MLNKVTVLDENPNEEQRLPTDIRWMQSLGENESIEEEKFENEFYEVDLSDEEQRREKKSMMTLRRRNKTRKQNEIPNE